MCIGQPVTNEMLVGACCGRRVCRIGCCDRLSGSIGLRRICAQLDDRRLERFGILGVLLQEVLIESAIVVVVVATGARTRGERRVLVRRPVRADIGVAQGAIIRGQCNAHRVGDARFVLGVACDALRCLELGQTVGVARVREFLRRMAVLRLRQLLGMAPDTRFLQHRLAAERGLVAGVTSQSDLMMAISDRTDQQPRSRETAVDHADDEHRHAGKRRQSPQKPEHGAATRHPRPQ